MAGLPYNDLDLLARAIESEAGQEPWQGKLAVGSVIDNRRKSGKWGEGWQDVILAPGQFSAFNNLTGYAGGEGGNDVWKRAPSEASRQAAQAIMAGGYEDPTGGALNYYNPAIANPAWGGDNWMAIGNHVFGTAAGGGGGKRMQTGKGPATGAAQNNAASTWQQIIEMSQGNQGGWRGGLGAALMALGQNLPSMASGQGMDFSQWAGQGNARKQMNQTLEWLKTAGREDLAAAVASGSLGAQDAVKMAYDQKGGGGLDTDLLNAANTLRDDIRMEFADVKLVSDGADVIKTVFDNPGAVSDYALAVAFAKIVDPGSVAREGEVSAVQKSGALFPAYVQALKNAVTGEGSLTDEMRLEIAQLGARLANTRIERAAPRLEEWKRTTSSMGVPWEYVWSGGGFSPMEVPMGVTRPGGTQTQQTEVPDDSFTIEKM